jgi:aminoacyl tRNA synthase complex-interacting multifunctional protein 1
VTRLPPAPADGVWLTAQVTEVGFVENSDKLYLCQVLVAADDVRQVVTGLRKHVPIEDLLNKKVVVITNLKVCPGPCWL